MKIWDSVYIFTFYKTTNHIGDRQLSMRVKIFSCFNVIYFLFSVPEESESLPGQKTDSPTADLPVKKDSFNPFLSEVPKSPESDKPFVSGSSVPSEMPCTVIPNETGVIRRIFHDVDWKSNNSIDGGLIQITRLLTPKM